MENKRLSNNWVSEDRFEHRNEAFKTLEREKQRRRGWKTTLIPHPELHGTFIEKHLK